MLVGWGPWGKGEGAVHTMFPVALLDPAGLGLHFPQCTPYGWDKQDEEILIKMRITSAPLHQTDNNPAQLHLFRNEQTLAHLHSIQIDILILNTNSTIDLLK